MRVVKKCCGLWTTSARSFVFAAQSISFEIPVVPQIYPIRAVAKPAERHTVPRIPEVRQPLVHLNRSFQLIFERGAEWIRLLDVRYMVLRSVAIAHRST